MKKSVIETVERRKAEILRQKTALKEKKDLLKQKISVPKVNVVILLKSKNCVLEFFFFFNFTNEILFVFIEKEN